MVALLVLYKLCLFCMRCGKPNIIQVPMQVPVQLFDTAVIAMSVDFESAFSGDVREPFCRARGCERQREALKSYYMLCRPGYSNIR